MLRRLPILILFLTAYALAKEDYRKEPCKTPDVASSCIQVHARLWAGNGTPSTRLWPISSHHIYGIYSNRYGLKHDEVTRDNEAPELHLTFPKGVSDNGGWTVYGDFEVCPLERQTQGHMQAACIASATHLIASKK